jgi:hypothetical protein
MGIGRIIVPFTRGPSVLACYSAGLCWDLWQSAHRFQYFYGTVENPLVSHGQQDQGEQEIDVDVSDVACGDVCGISPPCANTTCVIDPQGSAMLNIGDSDDEFLIVERASASTRESSSHVTDSMEILDLVDANAANIYGDDEEFLEFDVSNGFIWVDDPNVPEWILDDEYCKTMALGIGVVSGLTVFATFNLIARALMTSYNLSARAKKNFKNQLKKLKQKFSPRTTLKEMLEQCPHVDAIKQQRDGTFLVEARVKSDDSDKSKPSIWFQLGQDPNDTKPKEGKKGKTKGGWSMRSVKNRTQDSSARKYSFQDIYDDASVELALDGNWVRLSGEDFKDYWDKNHDWYNNHIEFVLNGHDAAMDYSSSRLECGALDAAGPAVPTTPLRKGNLGCPGFGLKKLEAIKESAVGGSMIDLDKYKMVTIHNLDGSFVGNGFCYNRNIIILRHYFDGVYGLQVNAIDKHGNPKRWEFRKCDCIPSEVVSEIFYLPKSHCSGLDISSTKKGFVTTIDRLSADNCVGAVTGFHMNGNGDLAQYFSPGDIIPPVHDKVDVLLARGDHACDTKGGCCGSVVVWSRDGTNSAIGLHCYGGSTDKSTAGKAPNGYIPFGPKLLEEANRLN